MKVNVFITIDTEHSLGGIFQNSNLKPVGNDRRIFGKIGNKEFGVPLIIDIAKKYSIPLTFFVEVFNKSYFGKNETLKVCKYVTDRGHDIQLHLHPVFLNFDHPNPDKQNYEPTMTSYNLSEQTEMIKKGKQSLISYGVKNLIAFRAGGFAANINTLKALVNNQLLIDSSLNKCYLKSYCKLHSLNINDIDKKEGIWELPVTNFLEFDSFVKNRLKPLDINGVNFLEIKSVLKSAAIKGPFNITIIMHSFSFIKNSATYVKTAKPRKYVIQRFENLCRFLADNSKIYNVRKISSLNQDELMFLEKRTNHTLPKVPSIFSILRLIEQTKEYFI